LAESCELAFRQAPRYSSRLDGCFPESLSDGSWSMAEIGFGEIGVNLPTVGL